MPADLAHLFHFALLTVFATLTMHSDVATFTIPNRLTGSMAATGVLSMIFLGPEPIHPLMPILAAVVVLLCGWLLSALNIWGAGDAKLMAAASLWIGPSAIPLFALTMVLTGCGLALTSLGFGLAKAARAAPKARWRPRLIMRKLSMPYGLAIGIAAIFTLAMQLSFKI